MKMFDKLFRKGNPKYINDVWYNASLYSEDFKYPVIFDADKQYINCMVGNKVIMNQTKDECNVYYEVVKVWRTSGGDFLYPSDAIKCKLKFSHITKKQTKNK